MKKLVMALVPLLMIACGEPPDENGDGVADGIRDPNNVSVVVPATPKGTVSGQVLTTQQRPLAAASVAMTVGSSSAPKTTTTDEAGNFIFQDVPGGAQVLLTFSKEGYATMRAAATVPNSAGNVPINNGNASFGPVLLSQTNASVTFTLIGPTGRPAQGVRASLEVEKAGALLFGSAEWNSSTVVAEATADVNGVVTFTNVPSPADIDRLDGQYTLVVSAHDENGDGILESNGLVKTYTGQLLLTGANAKPLTLAFTYDPEDDLKVEYSNLAVLKGGSDLPQYNMIKPGENIYLVFNQPVQTNSVIVGLTDEYGQASLTIGKTVANGGVTLTLSPQGVQPGREYNLYYRAVSATGGTIAAKTVAFFGGDPAVPLPISVESVRFQEIAPNNGAINNGEYVYVNFNQVLKARLAAENDPTQYAYVYVAADLNSSGIIGDAVGERDPATGKTSGLNSGFLLFAEEPLAPIATRDPAEKPVFPFTASGYTTRFRFRYIGSYATPAGTMPYPVLSPSSNFPFFIHFSALNPTVSAYDSGWGVAQTADITINGSSMTPIAAPVRVP